MDRLGLVGCWSVVGRLYVLHRARRGERSAADGDDLAGPDLEVDPVPAEFAYEPSPEAVLDEVLPRLLELRVYQAILEAQASEHSARMVAMRIATDAASDLVDELTLSFNKARQSDITGEILDVNGGLVMD